MRYILSITVFLGVLTSWNITAIAQVDRTVEDPWKQARELYGDRAYNEAIPYIVEAAQRDPSELRYIISLGRAHYQMGNYNKAVYYYDMYIGSPEAEQYSGRYSTASARAERNSANQKRHNPDSPPRLPNYQKRMYDALHDRLQSGPAITTHGGGAVGAWNALLQSGYVSPELEGLRQKLADRLAKEAEAKRKESDQWIANRSLEQWHTQAERYRLAKSLLPAPKPFEREGEEGNSVPSSPDTQYFTDEELNGWIAFCEGQIQYLNQNFETAYNRFMDSAERLTDIPEPLAGTLNAAIARPSLVTAEKAQTILQQLRESSDPSDPRVLVYSSYIRTLFGDDPAFSGEPLKQLFLH